MGATTVQPDENLRSLYVCLKNTNGKDQIDWSAMATAMNLNAPAARMRFRRLEDKIVKGMSNNGVETEAVAESESTPTPSPTKKRRVDKGKKNVENTDGKETKRLARVLMEVFLCRH